MTRLEALKQVRSFFGSEPAMAAAFGVSQPTVWRWLNQSKQLPPDKVLLAETLTQVSRHDLRPDIYPRGMVDGVPYAPDQPPVDEFGPGVPSNLGIAFDGRDRLAGTDARFKGAA